MDSEMRQADAGFDANREIYLANEVMRERMEKVLDKQPS